MESISQQAANLRAAWETDPRWAGIERDLQRRRTWSGCAARSQEEHTLARLGAERLWALLHDRATTCTRSAP